MTRYISYLIFLTCFMFITPLFAGTQTLSTYYPAPNGNYLNMTVNNELALQTGGACSAGTPVGIANVSGALVVCYGNTSYPLISNSLWASNNGGTLIYPFNTSENVCIGPSCASSNSTSNLVVTDSAGDTVSLGIPGSGIANAAGGPPNKWGLYAKGINVGAYFDGPGTTTALDFSLGVVNEGLWTNGQIQTNNGGNWTTITPSAASIATNGSITTTSAINAQNINASGNMGVQGNTSVGQGPSSVVTLGSGSSSTITLGSPTSGAITVCIGGSCGTLGMSCTSGTTCYATYGP